VWGESKLPVRSIIFTFIVDSCICLLALINDEAFDAMTSISTIGYQFSYAVPIIQRVTVARNTFRQGPWNLGCFSIPIGCVSSIWLVATNICFFFPTNFDENLQQNAEIFNYTCVVVGGTLIVAAFYWFLPKYGAWANFKGPRRPED
jgi:amino acid transporter